MAASPDYAASLAFLALLYPKGPWVLTAIHPDKKTDTGDAATRTRTFEAGQEKKLTAWLHEMGAEWNLYYQVNEPREPINGKKGAKHQLRAIHYLHLDIDRHDKETIEEGNARLVAMARDGHLGIPAPTAVISSGGGGVNVIWKLTEPQNVEGETEEERTASSDTIARYNKQIWLMFGADPCHDCNRILRLPGTLNRPNAKKREKYGRTDPLLSSLVFWNPERVYPISEFIAAVDVSDGAPTIAANHRVVISAKVAKIVDLAELGKIPPEVRHAIETHEAPEHLAEKWSGDRSKLLFWVLCELCRCDTTTIGRHGETIPGPNPITNDQLYALITDEKWAISASVVDKRGAKDRYAKRQIKRARDFADSPELEMMNSRYAVIANYGGECVVMEEVKGDLIPCSLTAITQFYQNQFVEVGFKTTKGKTVPVKEPLGKYWLQHEKRLSYRRVEFNPRGDSPEDVLNTWKGFSVQPEPGDCSLFYNHIRDNICGRDKACFEYLLGWIATLVQKPWERGHVAVVLRGGQGTGKGSGFAHIIGSLFAQGHYMHLSIDDHLVGKFNFHLENKVLVFADEAFFAGDKANTGRLKTLVTEPELSIERKGYDLRSADNHLHFIMASNSDWVVPAETDERRWFVQDILDTGQKQNPAYFRAMHNQLDNGGRAAFLHDMMNRDISSFEVRTFPQTKGLREQKLRSFKSEIEWWYSKLDMGDLMMNHPGWDHLVLCEVLQQDYFDYCSSRKIKPISAISLGKFLKEAVPEVQGHRLKVQKRVDKGARPMMYQFPPLRACRIHFDEKYGGPFDWTPVEEIPEVEAPNGETQDPRPGFTF